MGNEQQAALDRKVDDLAPLRSACVRVTCDSSVGSGYFIAPDLVVTCEHVVRRAGKGGQVSLTLFDSSAHEAHVEDVDASSDVALLRLPRGVPAVAPLRLVGEVERNRPFEVVGYPQVMQGNPLLLTGHIHDPVGRDSRGASAIVLFARMVGSAQGALMHGYSGSPVVVEGAVVGHLARVVIDAAAERPSAEFGVVFATPAREVLRLLQSDPPPATSASPPEPPGAAYNPRWYLPRPVCEQRALAYLQVPGLPAVLYGPRQSGKSWLLTHIANQWKQRCAQGAVVRINLLEFNGLEELSVLTEQLAHILVNELGGSSVWLDTYARDKSSPMTRLRMMLRRHVLAAGRPLLLAIDATDALLGLSFANDFFAGLRAWMQLASETPWDQLRLLLAISTTPSKMIDNPNQSPFNIADPVEIPLLSLKDVDQLTRMYNLQLNVQQLQKLYDLTGGHPYLVRRVLYDAAVTGITQGELPLDPHAEVFDAHLRPLLQFLKRESLEEVMAAVLRDPHATVTPDQEDLLKKAWLVRRNTSGGLEPTCTLHRERLARRR